MISLSSAGKRFGPKILFQEADWLITPQDRVGIVGANGTGKSTLLKVLAGIESFDYGTIQRQRGIEIGYLPQDGLSLQGRSVFDECLSVFSGIHDLERKQQELAAKMSELDHASAEYEQVATRFERIDHELRARAAHAVEAEVGSVLNGLGFRKEDWERKTEEFSGGWQMRIALAKLLLQSPNLLLLDEPTNHLDLESRNWLEEFLGNYPHAYVLISHDRYFLDTTVKKIVEVWNKRLHFYPGNYEKYLGQKAERRAQLDATRRNQLDKIEQLDAFINRFRYQATKAKQVQSRIKERDKIDLVEVPEEEKTIHFSFPQPQPSGRTVAEVKNAAKAYGAKQVFSNVNFVIERGDRIALVGVNGAGKSTLIKILAGSEALTTGEYRLGHNVEVDYFAQDQYKALDPNARVLDDIGTVAPRATQTELRSLLGCFLFSDEDVFKTIGVLSGGERNRYALARMLQRPSNFLLLDEPTNHLDLRAKDVLLQALLDFTGTVVFVSHDRYFIDRLATKVFEVGNGEVNVFPGNYEDYLYRKSKTEEAVSPAVTAAPTQAAPATTAQAQPIEEPKQKRINPIKLKQLRDRLPEVEEEITRVEAEISDCETQLQSFVSAEETKRVTELLATRRAELEQLMTEWEELSQTIEANA
jgi:ATP-binding cassette subfamily F protein 3